MELSSSEKNFSMFCHLIAFIGFVIPFGSVIGPLVLWLMKREESEFINYHGKESLNFQISILIYTFVAAILSIIIVGIFALVIIGILWIIFIVIASIRAANGEYYYYPITIRFIK